MAQPKRAAAKRKNSRTALAGRVVNPDFPRVTVHPGRMGGNACIRDLRVTVTNVLELLAAGHSEDEILTEYPYLEREDFRDVLGFAAWCTGRQQLAPTA